jgi:imidazolonepropionase-like amidohydrolase
VGVGAEGQVDIPQGEGVKEIKLENETLLPGLIDSHTHICSAKELVTTQVRSEPLTPMERSFRNYPYHVGVSTWEERRKVSDGIRILAAASYALNTIYSGVTTIQDAGGPNRLPWDLREAWRIGLIEAPRPLISGWAITITGGHGWLNGDSEADGVEGVRKKVRQLVKEDVDVIKIMASGGGATPRSNNREVAYTEDELRTIVEEAHRHNRVTFAHCEAFDSVGNAARAGIDSLEHCGFILPDGTRGFDEDAVKTMVKKKLFYDSTIQTGSQVVDSLRAKRARGETLTQAEELGLKSQEYKIRRKQENLVHMVDMGVQIVAGSDAGGDRLIRSMELMVEAGLTPMQVIVAATANGARALKMDHMLGTIKEGLKADIIAVKGDPSKNISDLRSIKMVMQEGKIITIN